MYLCMLDVKADGYASLNDDLPKRAPYSSGNSGSVTGGIGGGSGIGTGAGTGSGRLMSGAPIYSSNPSTYNPHPELQFPSMFDSPTTITPAPLATANRTIGVSMGTTAGIVPPSSSDLGFFSTSASPSSSSFP